MKHWLKRSLALLLCLVMLCAALPELSARAEEIELIPVDEEAEGEIAVVEEEFEEQHILNPNGEAPYVTTDPSSVTKTAGYTAKFTVKATGSSLKYQWYYRTSSSGSWQKTSLTGNTTATLSVYAKTTRNGFQYRCKVSNSYGYMYSKAATLTVKSGSKPTITTQPSNVTASVGATAKFTVKASNATSYQWYYRTSSSGSWQKTSLTGSTTASLSVYVKSTRNGFQYRCKVSNSNGYVYSSAAKLTCNLGSKPTITTQPKSVTKSQDYTAKFTVKASGATSYQWYYRTSSSGSWKKTTLTGATSATLSVKAKSTRNGYQYRCKVSNSSGYVYSNTVTLTVNLVTYRALLIGQTYNSATTSINPLWGDSAVQMMLDILGGVNGARGGSVWTFDWVDASHDNIRDAIDYAFGGADSNDVSIFYYNGHGVVTGGTDYRAGALVTLEPSGSIGYVYTYELADWLSAVPGKVVVLLDSCGAGAVIADNGTLSWLSPDEAAAQFGALAIRDFADRDTPVSNAGELRTSKFYVLAAAPYNEYSYAYSDIGGEMTYYMNQGLLGSMPADGSGDGKVTLNELYSYLDGILRSVQTTCVYPENSSYKIFAKK